MAEVGEREVEEVHDEKQFGEPEVRADPEVEEAEEQEVGRDVVGANVGRGVHVDCIAGIKGVGIDELEEEDDDPMMGQ